MANDKTAKERDERLIEMDFDCSLTTEQVEIVLLAAQAQGRREGMEAALRIAEAQEGCHDQQGTPSEFGHDAACQHIQRQIREMIKKEADDGKG